MRLAYLDCFAGISGDMFLGAMLDAGLDPEILHDAVRALDLKATLQIEKVDRSGITSIKVHVLENGHLAEAPKSAEHTHEPDHQHSHEHHHHPETQHFHKVGHDHDHAHPHTQDEVHEHAHEHPHVHGRSLSVIRVLIRNAALAEPVKNFALQTFELLGASEAKIHNVPVDEIHFHEVGAVDAIVDIVAASAGIHALSEQAALAGDKLQWHCSPLNVGGGTVQCAHGNFPVPAPATADLLRGLPTYSAHLQKELVTPTGAALVRALAPTFGTQPAMLVEQIGYGAGSRNPPGFPNVLRLSIGQAATAALSSDGVAESRPLGAPVNLPEALSEVESAPVSDTVVVLETALDDLSPQIIAHVTSEALALGALDVMTTAVGMKKGRPGTLITILADNDKSPALERLLLRETSTLGIRIREDRRICLKRHHTTVATPFGPIRIKIGSFDSQAINAAPEFEDCRSAALSHNVPVKQVLQAAVAAYVASTTSQLTPES
jgi:uncharacterized protein (TIGR00299 family) protein